MMLAMRRRTADRAAITRVPFPNPIVGYIRFMAMGRKTAWKSESRVSQAQMRQFDGRDRTHAQSSATSNPSQHQAALLEEVGADTGDGRCKDTTEGELLRCFVSDQLPASGQSKAYTHADRVRKKELVVLSREREHEHAQDPSKRAPRVD